MATAPTKPKAEPKPEPRPEPEPRDEPARVDPYRNKGPQDA